MRFDFFYTMDPRCRNIIIFLAAALIAMLTAYLFCCVSRHGYEEIGEIAEVQETQQEVTAEDGGKRKVDLEADNFVEYYKIMRDTKQ